MPGEKRPILTITNTQYFRDDGLYIYSSTDGQLDIIGDTVTKITAPTIELEASTGITLDGNATLDTGHYLIVPNDGVAGSGNGIGPLFNVTASGSIAGWFKVQTGTFSGYTPVYSGNVIT